EGAVVQLHVPQPSLEESRGARADAQRGITGQVVVGRIKGPGNPDALAIKVELQPAAALDRGDVVPAGRQLMVPGDALARFKGKDAARWQGAEKDPPLVFGRRPGTAVLHTRHLVQPSQLFPAATSFGPLARGLVHRTFH